MLIVIITVVFVGRLSLASLTSVLLITSRDHSVPLGDLMEFENSTNSSVVTNSTVVTTIIGQKICLSRGELYLKLVFIWYKC